MQPDEPDNRRVGTPLIPQRPYLHTQDSPAPARQSTQDAAAQLVRDQINSIYEQTSSSAPGTPQQVPITPQPELTVANPYKRTHTDTPQPQAEQWKQYHSAWQSYYQKYYERYYVGKVHEAYKTLASHSKQPVAASTSQTATPQLSSTDTRSTTSSAPTVGKDEALRDLRQQLRQRITATATKARRSRHFVPITAALAVVVLFSFLQYNRILIANVQAYMMPGNIDPQNIIVDPNVQENVGPDAKLIIPKINVDVPAIYGIGNDYDSQMDAMSKGVAHFCIPGACSTPGQIGNTVLSGHSSNDILDSGDYKFIFAQLDKLDTGDTIYANYQGKRYTYTVTKKEVVLPTEVNKLVYPTDKPVLTLITCTPLGTALKRLLITAEQVSPDPSTTATAAPAAPASSGASAGMPGNSPTFFQRVFGGGN